jgi:solute carrier family 66 (lysosomal lysine-arginine transporter), member 1
MTTAGIPVGVLFCFLDRIFHRACPGHQCCFIGTSGQETPLIERCTKATRWKPYRVLLGPRIDLIGASRFSSVFRPRSCQYRIPSKMEAIAFPPGFPPHCEPETPFLHYITLKLNTCVPTYPAYYSLLFGYLSIVCSIYAQLPQIIENFRRKSISGLSLGSVSLWFLGDVSSFIGCILTGQSRWQVMLVTYYLSVDCVIFGQWLWYDVSDKASASKSSARLLRSGSARRKGHLTFPLLAMLPFVAAASALQQDNGALEAANNSLPSITGAIFSWTYATIAFSSRIPQLYKNYARKTTSGLSPALVAAMILGNGLYALSLASNPCAWNTFGPYGGKGWVGKEGSVREHWLANAAPFWMATAGVLNLDVAVLLQIWIFGSVEEPVVRAGDIEAIDDIPKDLDLNDSVEMDSCRMSISETTPLIMSFEGSNSNSAYRRSAHCEDT